MRIKKKSPQSRIEIYTHEPMTNWLSPKQLMQIWVRTTIATTIGSFADPRDVQAALNPPAQNKALSLQECKTTWIDFVADTGDGWDSTYTVAWCASRDSLAVSGIDAPLPRAHLLVLGGDQVYPSPAKNGYRTHFLDPYRSAFPAAIPPQISDADPLILALPGNHDWYDGLRGFTSLFCSDQPIGRWRTSQRTSYFAVKLCPRWWLWGVDLQLESTLDPQQLKYFRDFASLMLQSGDHVIICTPEPSWVNESERLKREINASEEEQHARKSRIKYKRTTRWLRTIETQAPRFLSLRKIEHLINSCNNVTIAAVLAGDDHHYVRYQPISDNIPNKPHRITCGGGGAYLLGTHQLPDSLCFRTEGGNEEQYTRRRSFPDAATSRSLRSDAWKLPLKNPVFCLQLAGLYLFYLWILQSASKVPNLGLDEVSLMEYLARIPITLTDFFCTIPIAVLRVMAHSPGSVLWTVLILSGAAIFTMSSSSDRRSLALVAGLAHGGLHLLLAVMLLWSIAHLNLGPVAESMGYSANQFLDHPLQVLLFVFEVSIVGGLIGGVLFGVWIVAANGIFGWHSEDVFSSQGIADYKSFLRMKIDASGLTIYPIKIERVCRRWKIGTGIKVLLRVGQTWRLRVFPDSGERFEPVDSIKAELIEPPIHIPSTSAISENKHN